MTDYRGGTIWDHPELYEPAETVRLRCGCGSVGPMPVRQVVPGFRESLSSPAEPASFAARCRVCGAEHDLADYDVECEVCGLLMAKAAGEFDGGPLCGSCFPEAWDAWVHELTNHVEAEAPRGADGSIHFQENDRA